MHARHHISSFPSRVPSMTGLVRAKIDCPPLACAKVIYPVEAQNVEVSRKRY